MAKKQAVGYVRVSGKGQVDKTGFDRQQQAIKAYAGRQGYNLLTFYQEAHTGTEAERPVFNKMLQDILSNACRVVIVESLDRFARDLAVQMRLIAVLFAKGITLIATNTGRDVTADMEADPMLRAMVQVQGVFSELDKSLIVRKLHKARSKIRQEQGRCEGRKPYGFYPDEAKTLKRIRQLHRKPRGEERLGPYQIAKVLNQEHLPTRTGKPWTGTVVKRILRRPQPSNVAC